MKLSSKLYQQCLLFSYFFNAVDTSLHITALQCTTAFHSHCTALHCHFTLKHCLKTPTEYGTQLFGRTVLHCTALCCYTVIHTLTFVVYTSTALGLSMKVQCSVSSNIGAKPNLYCKAIELVCGGSPKVCVLVESKALHRVNSKQWQLKPAWISCLYSTSVQSWMNSMETICSSHKYLYRAFSLYEAHQIRKANASEPTLLEQGRFGECPPIQSVEVLSMCLTTSI